MYFSNTIHMLHTYRIYYSITSYNINFSFLKTDAFHMVNALKNVHLWVLQQLSFQTSKHMFKVMYPNENQNEKQNKHSHEET